MQGNSQASYLENYSKSQPEDGGEYKAFSFWRVGSRARPMITFVKKENFVEAISIPKEQPVVTKLNIDSLAK